MTTSDHKKILKQLRGKTAKLKKFKKHNVPKERSASCLKKKCRRCGRIGGHIGKYGLKICRQCFREIATRIGFTKFN